MTRTTAQGGSQIEDSSNLIVQAAILKAQAVALIEEVGSRYPNAVDLARRVSLAARVEPELLRKVRLELLPEVDAGTEADLWFSPLVQSENALGLVLLPEVEELLRQELSEAEDQLLDRVWNVLQQAHRDAPPVIRLEEEVTWLALSKRHDAPNLIERRLQEVIVAMVEENRHGLALWASHILPRLPEAARKSNAAWMLAIGAGARLGGRQILKDEVPSNLVGSKLRWILPKDMQRIPVGVRLLVDRIEFGDPLMQGAHIIELPKTNPLLLVVAWEEQGDSRTKQVAWPPGQFQTVQIGPGTITIQTALGDVYRLYPQQGFLQGTSTYFRGHKKELPELERWIQEDWEETPQTRSLYADKMGLNEFKQSIKDDAKRFLITNLGKISFLSPD